MDGTTLSVSKLRQNAAKVIENVAKKGEPYIIISRSEPKAVLADIKYYNALENAVMDLTDAAEAEKAKKEPRISFKNYIEKRWGSEIV